MKLKANDEKIASQIRKFAKEHNLTAFENCGCDDGNVFVNLSKKEGQKAFEVLFEEFGSDIPNDGAQSGEVVFFIDSVQVVED